MQIGLNGITRADIALALWSGLAPRLRYDSQDIFAFPLP
jgi:hypothetical protein